MSLEDSLARVPGLAGYLGQTQFNNQRDLSGLQQMGLLEGILTKHRTAQEEQQIKGILSQSTDLQSAIPALMKVGPLGITTAQHLATLGKAQQEQKLTAQLMGGGSMEKMTPEQLDLLGQKLALGGHPGASTVMSIADKRRTEAQKRTEDTQTLGSLQGAPTTITPERATAPVGMENMPDAQKIAALQSMGPGAKSISFLPPGEPTQLAPTVTKREGGAFAPFFDSPIPAIASAARDYQRRADANPPQISGRDAEKRLEMLQKAQTSFEAAQTGRQFAVDNRPAPQTAQPKAPSGYQFKADGSLEPIKGGPRDVTATEVKPLEMDAMRYLADGTMPPNMGRGVQGAAEAKAIRARSEAIATELGITPDEIRANQAVAKSVSAGLAGLQRQKALVLAYEKTALKGADIALEMSDKVSRDTNVPIFDKWIQAGRKNVLGDPDVTRLQNAVETLTNEYAKVMSGSSGGQATTVSMQQHAREMLSAAMTKEQFKKTVELMTREMRETREPAFDAQIAEMKNSMVSALRKQKPAQDAPAAPAPASGLSPQEQQELDALRKRFGRQ